MASRLRYASKICCRMPTLVGTAMTRAAHQTADNARQGALHAGDGDDHLRLSKFLGMREQAVQAGDHLRRRGGRPRCP